MKWFEQVVVSRQFTVFKTSVSKQQRIFNTMMMLATLNKLGQTGLCYIFMHNIYHEIDLTRDNVF